MIRFTHRGDFSKTQKFMTRVKRKSHLAILEKYARIGVDVLAAATPKDSGDTTRSWGYEIVSKSAGFSINWTNSNVNDGAVVAILIQYGHATRSGTFVEGRDFINPAMKPVFDEIAENIWKEITSL